MNKNHAILLLGPTGSGKTPLGSYIEKKGIWDKRCFHFDFGSELRNISDANVIPLQFTKYDVDYIAKVLKEVALLENETFYIAEKILNSFITKNSITSNDIILLNGLPRHVGQAKDVDSIVTIKLVIYLDCSFKVIKERVQLNIGGDRSDRTDDSLEEIKKKLEIFHDRTSPMLQYYKKKKIPIEKIRVSVNTNPDEILRYLNK